MCIANFVENEICLPHSDFARCIDKFVKIPCRNQIFMHIKFYMHHLKTCNKCQATEKTCKTSIATTKDIHIAIQNFETSRHASAYHFQAFLSFESQY